MKKKAPGAGGKAPGAGGKPALGGKPSTHEAGFEVKKWRPVFCWKYNFVEDKCSMCRSELNGPCVECQANHQEECPVAFGTCGVRYELISIIFIYFIFYFYLYILCVWLCHE